MIFKCSCGRKFNLPKQALAWGIHHALTGHKGPKPPKQ
jgi:hypothetical protein